MTKSLLLILAGLIVMPSGTWAKSQDLKALRSDYLAVQSALANDSLKGAAAAAGKIKSGAKDPAVVTHAENLSAAKTLDEARESFKALSELFIADLSRAADKDVEIVSCSMAKARWIQKKGEVRNPYYGQAMLTCGERSL